MVAFFKNDERGGETVIYAELVIVQFDKWLNDVRAMDDLRKRRPTEVVRMIREKWENIKRGR